MNLACIQFQFGIQLDQWLDYIHVKLWSIMNFCLGSREENVQKLCIFMLVLVLVLVLGCDS